MSPEGWEQPNEQSLPGRARILPGRPFRWLVQFEFSPILWCSRVSSITTKSHLQVPPEPAKMLIFVNEKILGLINQPLALDSELLQPGENPFHTPTAEGVRQLWRPNDQRDWVRRNNQDTPRTRSHYQLSPSALFDQPPLDCQTSTRLLSENDAALSVAPLPPWCYSERPKFHAKSDDKYGVKSIGFWAQLEHQRLEVNKNFFKKISCEM